MSTPDVQAHRLAETIVQRMKGEKALGVPSLYNVVREVLIEAFKDDAPCTCIPYHLIGCPQYPGSWKRRADR